MKVIKNLNKSNILLTSNIYNVVITAHMYSLIIKINKKPLVSLTANILTKFEPEFIMGCGCNKKKANRSKRVVNRGKKVAARKSLPLVTIRRKALRNNKAKK